MPKNQFLTPSTSPTAAKCRRLYIPDSLEWLEIVQGLLVNLTYDFNWEQSDGGITPADAASRSLDMLYSFLNDSSSECPQDNIMIGMIVPFAGATVPTSYLACDGASYTEAAYPDLYAALDSAFKNTSTHTFVTPDLRGKTIIGTGQGSGLTNRTVNMTGGAETHILDVNEIPSHTHILDTRNAATDGTGKPRTGNAETGTQTRETQATGGGQGHNNMPPFRALKYIIRAVE